MIEMQVTRYFAFDDKEFETKEECIDYENNELEVLDSRIIKEYDKDKIYYVFRSMKSSYGIHPVRFVDYEDKENIYQLCDDTWVKEIEREYEFISLNTGKTYKYVLEHHLPVENYTKWLLPINKF